ncbi:S-adenosyl-L-methionine-dependent methyltransferase [Rhizodiscina lignyota]|uniref:S-adenosyl-L-methionine-dependent methyltransferase n=1 Tax=Rhizodiscina lignyota TaxID=1504668 RepID=A0A9P4I6H6_9PEZI|nr:S-adenosyl-L-methionine-dependent methyltransferase [Rhizodiscina lignyota]
MSQPTSLDPQLKDFYAKAAQTYEKNPRGTRTPTYPAFLHAQKYLPPVTPSSIVHDNACGPGIVTGELITQGLSAGQTPPKIYATDLSPQMIDVVRNRIATVEGWKEVEAFVCDGKDLSGLDDAIFTHSITNFGIFGHGTNAIYRTLKPGGTALVTTFKVQPVLLLAREVRKAINSDLSSFPPGFNDEWGTEGWLRRQFEEGGFAPERVRIEVVTFLDAYRDVEEVVQDLGGDF